MAVYTHLSQEEIAALLEHYALGRLLYAKGIAEGVENSNFLIGTQQGGVEKKYILTLYEKRVNAADLPFFMEAMECAAAGGVPCPRPVHAVNGDIVHMLRGKPAALVTFLPGGEVREIHAHHLAALGEATAKLHAATPAVTRERANALSLAGWQHLAQSLAGALDAIEPGLQKLVDTALGGLAGAWPQELPRGVIHADLFPDNVFFDGPYLSGIIDFYFACNDFLAYELAVIVNAWCFEDHRTFNRAKAAALFEGYQRHRPLTSEERAHFPALARGAALRFLLTRAYDLVHHPEGALVTPKNPLDYAHRLQYHLAARGPDDYGL